MNKKLLIHFSKTGDFPEIDYYLKLVIRRAILNTLEAEDFPFAASVSVTLCNNSYIRKNKTTLQLRLFIVW